MTELKGRIKFDYVSQLFSYSTAPSHWSALMDKATEK